MLKAVSAVLNIDVKAEGLSLCLDTLWITYGDRAFLQQHDIC